MEKKPRLSDNPDWMKKFNKRFKDAKEIAKTVKSVEVIETDEGRIIETKYYNGKIRQRKFERI